MDFYSGICFSAELEECGQMVLLAVGIDLLTCPQTWIAEMLTALCDHFRQKRLGEYWERAGGGEKGNGMDSSFGGVENSCVWKNHLKLSAKDLSLLSYLRSFGVLSW